MYLSRAELDPTRRSTMIALTSPQKFHGAVENSFSGERRRRLWRLDRLGERLYLLLGALKPCYLEAEQEQWLLEQAGKHGFALTEGAFQVTRKQTCHFRKNGKRPVTLLAVTYEGILQVTDPEAFQEMLCQGIGRGKAYGLGLMTILHGGSSHG